MQNSILSLASTVAPWRGRSCDSSGEGQPPWRDGERGNARVNEGSDPRGILIPCPGLCHGGPRSREHSVVSACDPSPPPRGIQNEGDPDGPEISEYADAIKSHGITIARHMRWLIWYGLVV